MSDTSKECMISFRLDLVDKVKLIKNASEAGLTLSDYIRECIEERSRDRDGKNLRRNQSRKRKGKSL